MNPQYPNPQSYITPPEPPRRKIRPWMWIVGGALLFLALLVGLAVNMGQKIGAQMQQGMDKAQLQQDSLRKANEARRLALYEEILDTTSADSAYTAIQAAVKRLRENTEAIHAIFQQARDSFAASLPDTSTFTMLNTKLSHDHFIRSGLALKLKDQLSSYEKFSLEDRPDEVAQDSFSVFLLTDKLLKTTPQILRKMLAWENTNFNQPPTSVFMNFKMIQRLIETFELNLLEAYADVPVVPSTAADTTGI